MNWEFYFAAFQKISSRYFIVALIGFLIFYVIFRRRFFFKKIQQKFPANNDYFRELGYSLLTMLIFSSVIVFLNSPTIVIYTTRYQSIDEYGWLYYFSVFPILFIMHDLYFYIMHRIMHHPSLFKYIHLVHHKSTNPSPWAAYAFHPLEAIIEQGIVVIFYFTLPIHISHLAIFFLFSIVYNVYGHLGYELYPKGFNKTRIGRWINTSVNHNQHHQYFKGNYGLYTLIWDRIFGTIRKDYDAQFETISKRQPDS
ncbi:sterol desaturase family protein [Sediminibacterium sp.]|uniref:sterol desaturase family protein n=1 Tax=Sediminibacterium sp. TaxID=1917865 RepID=UPI003F699147